MNAAKHVQSALVFNLATDADDPVLVFTTTWLRGLAGRLETIDVITMRAGRLDLPENVTVHSLGKERGHSEPRRLLTFYKLLLGLLRTRSYDVCFAHQAPLFSILAAPLLKLSGVPIVLWYAHGATSLRLRLAEKVVDEVVTSSPEGFRLPSNKVTVTGQGVDTDRYSPAAPRAGRRTRRFTILAVGRIAQVKRLDVVVELIEHLVRRHGRDAVVARLIGAVEPADLPYAEGLQESIERKGLGKSVELVGPLRVDELVQEYRAADLLVNPSRTGSLDKVVLEAMSCGVPVISSNEPYGPLLGQVDERLFVASGQADAMAAACERLMRMSVEERRALGERLRDVVVRDHGLERLMGVFVDDVFARNAHS